MNSPLGDQESRTLPTEPAGAPTFINHKARWTLPECLWPKPLFPGRGHLRPLLAAQPGSGRFLVRPGTSATSGRRASPARKPPLRRMNRNQPGRSLSRHREPCVLALGAWGVSLTPLSGRWALAAETPPAVTRLPALVLRACDLF